MRNEIDGMVYCYEIDQWVTKEEYNDFVAEQLQQKIAEDLYDHESDFDKFIDGLAEKNGVTNY